MGAPEEITGKTEVAAADRMSNQDELAKLARSLAIDPHIASGVVGKAEGADVSRPAWSVSSEGG
jgi:hypothetical protein